MIPPALATKSGAHRIPRSVSCSATLVGRELVVGRARDRAAAQRGDRLALKTRRARRGEHVDVGAAGRRRGRSSRRRARRPAPACPRRRRRRRAARRPRPARARARRRRARGRRRRSSARRGRRCPRRARSHAHGLLDAERGPRARVAGAAALDREAGHVAGVLGDHGHVGVGGADVLGGHVAAAEHVDGVGEVQQRAAAVLGSSGGSPARRMITPFPPPSGRSATAALNVIARDSRSASATASRESA